MDGEPLEVFDLGYDESRIIEAAINAAFQSALLGDDSSEAFAENLLASVLTQVAGRGLGQARKVAARAGESSRVLSGTITAGELTAGAGAGLAAGKVVRGGDNPVDPALMGVSIALGHWLSRRVAIAKERVAARGGPRPSELQALLDGLTVRNERLLAAGDAVERAAVVELVRETHEVLTAVEKDGGTVASAGHDAGSHDAPALAQAEPGGHDAPARSLAEPGGDAAKIAVETTAVTATADPSSSPFALQPVSTLSAKQRTIHEQLAQPGAMAKFRKREVSMSDLRAIGRVTGDEYSMYTLRAERLVIRGDGNRVVVPDQAFADALKNGAYGKWSGHTHPPGYSSDPGPEDRSNIPKNQRRSGIWADEGAEEFYRDDFAEAEQRSIDFEKFYGPQADK